MRLGRRKHRVDSLKLVNYTRNENAHKVRKKNFIFYYVAVICKIAKCKEPTLNFFLKNLV